MASWSVQGKEDRSISGTSLTNEEEAKITHKLVNHCLERGVKAQDIGVITPYEGQFNYILQNIQDFPILKDIEVGSVDAFQGREKDYMRFSCVRSNEETIGFLQDHCRLNFALTRAKSGLIIVGNDKVLEKHPQWDRFIYHYSREGYFMDSANSQRRSMEIPP